MVERRLGVEIPRVRRREGWSRAGPRRRG